VGAARKMIAAKAITGAGLASMSDTELTGLFPDSRAKVSDLHEALDFAAVVRSMRSNPHYWGCPR
jgi:hypothetical protein